MKALILAATHERAIDSRGVEVPRPLLDLDEEPLLTQLMRRLTKLQGLDSVVVVTNDTILPEIEAWAQTLPQGLVAVSVFGDGTHTHDQRRGAIGDLVFALEAGAIDDDLLVIGGDNWFTYNLSELTERGRQHSPAVVVTRMLSGNRVSRFGVAQVDPSGLITAFVEKPETMQTGFKASCAYYFSKRDLAWLRTFAAEGNTRCSPGIFLEWLVKRAPVYAVEIDATWYDVGVGEGKKLTGPGLLRFRQIVREIVNPTRSTWERAAGQRLQWVSSHEDLLDVLNDPDPNLRIIACDVLGCVGDLVDKEALVHIQDELVKRLGDSEVNQIAYAGTQADEDSLVYVSEEAASSLVHLGYASDVKDVFSRARKEGHCVSEH